LQITDSKNSGFKDWLLKFFFFVNGEMVLLAAIAAVTPQREIKSFFTKNLARSNSGKRVEIFP
jgi:hypothetical protein